MKEINNWKYAHVGFYNMGIAEELGIEAGIIYCYLLNFRNKHQPNEWFEESLTDLTDSLPFSLYQIRKGCQLLEKAGWLKMQVKRGITGPIMHFQIEGGLTKG